MNDEPVNDNPNVTPNIIKSRKPPLTKQSSNSSTTKQPRA
jgi:hypothetical protein